MSLTCEHRAFIVEDVLKNEESYIAAVQNFKNHYELSRNDHVPTRKSAIMWVNNFRADSVLLKRKTPGRPRSVRTPENILTHIITDFRVGI